MAASVLSSGAGQGWLHERRCGGKLEELAIEREGGRDSTGRPGFTPQISSSRVKILSLSPFMVMCN